MLTVVEKHNVQCRSLFITLVMNTKLESFWNLYKVAKKLTCFFYLFFVKVAFIFLRI